METVEWRQVSPLVIPFPRLEPALSPKNFKKLKNAFDVKPCIFNFVSGEVKEKETC